MNFRAFDFLLAFDMRTQAKDVQLIKTKMIPLTHYGDYEFTYLGGSPLDVLDGVTSYRFHLFRLWLCGLL